MDCCNMVMSFLEERRGKEIKLLVEGGKFQPIRGRLLDFNDSAIVIEEDDGMQHLFDMDYVISVADAEEWMEEDEEKGEEKGEEEDEEEDEAE